MNCGNCHQVKYCSKACQKLDWKDIHKYYFSLKISMNNDLNHYLDSMNANFGKIALN